MYKKLKKNKRMPVGASLVLARLQRNYQNKSNNISYSGITLIALILTTIFSYDEKLKCSNNKGFLLATI